MTYKGYTGVLEVDEESGELFGTVLGLRDGITFVGATVGEARESFERSVDFYLERCAATGKRPDRPYAGSFMVRVSPETHRELERIALAGGRDISEVASEVLDSYAGSKKPVGRHEPHITEGFDKPVTRPDKAPRRGKRA
jgi:predicted HicB family RNase H-like nuclease